ncbi:MAG: hypothetical protein ACFFCW_20605 [Candidatus Hodarchaeota archaeon]
MKKNPLFLVGFFLCIFFSTTLVQQAFPQQKLSQPVQKMTGTGKIDQFLKVLQGAKSLKEVQAAFNQARFSKAEVKQLQSKIEASPSLKKKLDSLYNQAEAAARVESGKMESQEAKQTAIAVAQLNQNLKARHLQSIRSIKQVVALMRDPEVRCKADAPSISEVSDVMPGVEFAIRGMGLGKDSGHVDVITQTRIFRARINQWNSCVVYAQLSSDIAGVRQDDQATVSLTTNVGIVVRHFARFTPLMETKFYQKQKALNGWYWGASKDYTFWNSVLKNDWYVLGTGLQHRLQGHAEITLAPPQNTPNCSSRTRVHAGVAAFGKCFFYVFQRIAGPKGTSPH